MDDEPDTFLAASSKHRRRKPSIVSVEEDDVFGSASQNESRIPKPKHKYLGNYELLKTLGEGSFAKVAIKIIEKEKVPDEYNLNNMYRESSIMKMLNHPNIIQIYEIIETKRELCLVLEYASGGEVLDYLISQRKLEEREAKRLVMQIVFALEYCHSLNIVHRDLKAENFLLDENQNIKISDFGLSNRFDPGKLLSTCCGSPVYSAPEVLQGQKYVGPEVDAWSLGVNIYTLVVGELPFKESNVTALYEAISKGNYSIPSHVSPECQDLISRLLVVNPKKRWTCAQARSHPWLNCGKVPRPKLPKWQVMLKPEKVENIDMGVIDAMESMGFERDMTIESLLQSKYNQSTGTYCLLVIEKNEAQQQLSKQSESNAISVDQDLASELNIILGPSSASTERIQQSPSTENFAFRPTLLNKSRAPSFDGSSAEKLQIPKNKPQQLKPLHQEKNSSSESFFRQTSSEEMIHGNSKFLSVSANVSRPTSGNASKVGRLSPLGATPRIRKHRSIHIDESLYISEHLSPEDIKLYGDAHKAPRTIKSAFNCESATTLPAKAFSEKLRDVLYELHVEYDCENFFYMCGLVDDEVELEVEICKLPGAKMYGLRFKRKAGDIWKYKDLCSKITERIAL